jgi:hypothetical protein
MINLLLAPLRIVLSILPWNVAAPNFVERLFGFTLYSMIAWSVAASPRISFPYLNPYLFSGMRPPELTQAEQQEQHLVAQVRTGTHRVVHPVGLYIRRSPGMSRVLMVIPSGKDVQVMGEAVMADNEVWVPVRYRDSEGWSAVKHLKKI